ncbi:purine-nucleoside phosphorylase [Buchnera aphidicola (Pemphigus obesinymphae)]|uniref:purine-nucleoside phosphorylase n=1 Tax=Buchnera aphidicola TaxID=9 RepID=UPI002238076A|nr:purine-nucleoside phosphorylase [Buchnera aphidicola]MCW5196436.1 purine-nucleoside phosphorylase [Buchnera aphidicola (Pemphigus obesinymphae)]
MVTPHIDAKVGDFSDVVIMSGDPIRAKYIADNYLKNVTKVNNVRSMFGYTGTYKNKKISIMSHGIGIPSCSIYVKELITEYLVKRIIRVGTCGAIIENMELHDIVVGMGACTDSKVNRLNFKDNDFAAICSFSMLFNIVKVAKKLNVKINIGNLFTTDLFYSDDQEILDVIEKYGILGIEMETAGLYALAAKYKIEAISICTVTDHIKKLTKISSEDRQSSLDSMIRLALESTLL